MAITAHGSAARRDCRLVVAVAVVAMAAIGARAWIFDFESGDYLNYLKPWSIYIQQHDFAAILRVDYTNYTPPYVYFLAAAVRAGLPPLVAVKALSFGFDLLLVIPVALLLRDTGVPRWRVLGGVAAVLLAPSIVLNSAMWGQCDALYAVFVVAAVYLFAARHPYLAMTAIGIGLTVKLQVLFILPLAIVLTLRGRVPVAAWLVGVPIFFAAGAPALFAGRPFTELALIYKEQAVIYNELSLDAASLYAWLPNLPAYGFIFTLSALGLIGVAWCVVARYGPPMDIRGTTLMGLFFVLLCPFVLPHMHDRYFYLADVFSIVYAFQRPSRWFLPVAIVTGSVICYIPFLWGETPVPISVAAALMAGALAVTTFDVAKAGQWRRPHSIRPTLVHVRDEAMSAVLAKEPAAAAAAQLPADAVHELAE